MPPRTRSQVAAARSAPAEGTGQVAGGSAPAEGTGNLPNIPTRTRSRRVAVGQLTNVQDQDENPAPVVDRKRKRIEDVAGSSATKSHHDKIEEAVTTTFNNKKAELYKLLDDGLESLKAEVVSEVSNTLKDA